MKILAWAQSGFSVFYICACGQLKTRIGESVAEKLEFEPASFVVIQTVRAKYACGQCHDGLIEAPAATKAVEKSLAAEGLLPHVVVSKDVDHLPSATASAGTDLCRRRPRYCADDAV